MIVIKTIINVNFDKLTAEITGSSIGSKYLSIVDYDIDEDQVHLNFTEALTTTEETTLDSIIASHDSTPNEEPLESVYSRRESDGVSYYRSVQSKLAKDYIDGVNTFATTRTIETKLQPVVALLRSGNWLSAKDELENNVTTDPSDLTDTLKTFILDGLNDYINANY